MKKIVFVILVVISASNWSCTNNSSDTIQIGAIIPLTGRFSEMSLPIKYAMDIAVEEINNDGGINGKSIEIIYGDSKGEAKTGAIEAQRMITLNKINIITTFLTGVSEAVKPVTESNDVLLLAQTVSPTILNDSKYVIRFHYSFIEEGKKLADYILSQGVRRVVYIQSNDPSGSYRMENVIKPVLQQNSVELNQLKYNVGNKDFSGLVLKAINAQPEMLCIDGYGNDIANILKELYKYDTKRILLLGNIGFVEFPKGTPNELYQNFVFTIPEYLLFDNGVIINFTKKYKERTGQGNVGYAAYYAYDMIKVLCTNIKKDYTVENIKSSFSGSYSGITGEFKIQNDGEVITSVGLAEYDGTKIIQHIELK